MSRPHGILVRCPGLSQAAVLDLLGGIRYRDPRLKVVEAGTKVGFSADFATVALVSSLATMATTELVKAAVHEFAAWLKSRNKKPDEPVTVKVVVKLALGGTQTAVVTDASQVDELLPSLPTDASEIECVNLSPGNLT